MESFSRGWSFLKQAWQMAFQDKDLLKPSVYALIAGMIVSVIGIIPIIGAVFLFGDSRFGNAVLFVLGGIMIFVQFVVSYIFSAMTVYLIYGYLAEGDGRMDKAWAVVRRDFFDILTLAAASTVVNLLRNAVQYTERGFIRVNFSQSRLSISDSGIGIEPFYLPLLYERFFRGSTQGEGLGIGLAIVKRICDHYGWIIDVESTPGKGATFHITFPASQAGALTNSSQFL